MLEVDCSEWGEGVSCTASLFEVNLLNRLHLGAITNIGCHGRQVSLKSQMLDPTERFTKMLATDTVTIPMLTKIDQVTTVKPGC